MDENVLRLNGKTLFMSTGAPPFFWLGLIDNVLLNGAQEGRISITQRDLVKNAQNMRDFLDDEYHDAMPMFMDFFRYLRKNFSSKKKLVLEIPLLREEEGRVQVRQELAAISERRIADLVFLSREDSPHLACGRPMQSSFEKFSTSYFQMNKVEAKKAPQQFERSKFIQYLILLALCPVLTVMVVTSFINDGISLPLGFMAFGNIIFYIYSISHIQVQWQLFKHHKVDAEMTVDPEGWIDDF
jgi:hypothetical protein